jgi:hypothetical protein
MVFTNLSLAMIALKDSKKIGVSNLHSCPFEVHPWKIWNEVLKILGAFFW